MPPPRPDALPSPILPPTLPLPNATLSFDFRCTDVFFYTFESYTFAEHERRVGQLADEMGFTHVSLSSEVMSMVKAVPRGFTTAADAYLTPVIKRYVKSFRSGFDQVRAGGGGGGGAAIAMHIRLWVAESLSWSLSAAERTWVASRRPRKV